MQCHRRAVPVRHQLWVLLALALLLAGSALAVAPTIRAQETDQADEAAATEQAAGDDAGESIDDEQADASAQESGDAEEGYIYKVQRGDSWNSVSRNTGIPVRDLQAANPQAVRVSGWLLVGEELFIPASPQQEADEHIVQSGESWNSIADLYGVPVNLLQSTNPRSVRYGLVLYRGERLVIPRVGDAAQPADEETTEEPATEEPATDESAAEEPATEEEAADESAAEEPATEEEATDESAAEEPATEEEATDESATEEPATEEEATDESAAEEPATDESAAEEPATEEEATDESATEEPATEEEATDESAAEEPATEEEATDQDAAEEPATEEEATDQAGQPQDEIYVVQPGESWNSIARKFDVPVDVLQAANPDLIRPNLVLFRGDQLVIPAAGAEGEAVTDDTVTDEADADTEDAGTEDAETEDAGTEVAETEGAGEEEAASPCPADFAGYPELIAEALNQADGGLDAAAALLSECGALADNGLTVSDWTGDGLDDAVLIYRNPAQDTGFVETDLLIINGAESGFDLAYQARAAGEVTLLATEDINQDGRPDIVWQDTTCGASTCFDLLSIRSWDDAEWVDWVDAGSEISMAYAEISLDNASEAGQGNELILSGGVYGSVGAGPQRGRVEVWGSPGGAPYSLLEMSYNPSDCLYHTVIDANAAFLQGPDAGFATAEELYTQAIGDEDLIQCWVRENEVDELRAFSYFRLALLAAYQGETGVAQDVIGALIALYPDNPYAALGQLWSDTLVESGSDPVAACEAAIAYAEANPAVVEILADYGYANPSFTAADVCPILDVDVPVAQADAGAAPDSAGDEADTAPAEEPAATDGQTAAGVEAAAEETATEASSPASDSAPAEDAQAEPDTEVAGQAESAADESAAATDAAQEDTVPMATAADDEEDGAGCPADLLGYEEAFPDMLSEMGADGPALEAWLRECGAMDDDRGAVRVADINGDGRDDVAIFPSIISDLGFGPNGSQGALLIYHAGDDGYELIHSPEIYGLPSPLAIDDLNADGAQEVAWIVESCSTFCVSEVQMISWQETGYVPMIQPGATMAEGEASFAPVGGDDPGAGQQLILTGGLSGTAEGGLAVPHTEIWQSIDGQPFQRLSWTYDRETEGANCMGLRLIEADVALQAASVLGYSPAIDLYTAALETPLDACSIFGLSATDELILLQGLASFRLVQAQAMGGDVAAATETLEGLRLGQPDGDYTVAAEQWLAAYQENGDVAAACQAVLPIFEENADLWQITDNYGYNHPALAAEQICFVPFGE